MGRSKEHKKYVEGMADNRLLIFREFMGHVKYNGGYLAAIRNTLHLLYVYFTEKPVSEGKWFKREIGVVKTGRGSGSLPSSCKKVAEG